MKIIRIPTFWTAEQADTIHEFLGELRAAVWHEYHEDIQQLHDEVHEHEQAQECIDDDLTF